MWLYRLWACLLVAGFAAPAFAASVEEMAGQMIMVGFRGTGEAPLHRDIVVLQRDIAAGRVGGVILFERDARTGERGRNVRSVEQVRRLTGMLQAKARIPLFVGVDQEGGKVQRFLPAHGVAATPAPEEMGKGTPAATRAYAATLGAKLRESGVNVDFAPSLDVNVNPQSPAIGALGRSFGPDAATVVAHAGAFAQGLQEQGILFCWKHFPGHGSAAVDSHHDLPDITATWSRAELEPYAKLLQPGMPGMVMVGHLYHSGLDAKYPSGLSPAIINGLLRRELGWDGAVITDDLHMGAVAARYSLKETVALAVDAGVDILLFGNNQRRVPYVSARQVHAVLVQLVREGRISRARLEESYIRILRLKGRLAAAENQR